MVRRTYASVRGAAAVCAAAASLTLASCGGATAPGAPATDGVATSPSPAADNAPASVTTTRQAAHEYATYVAPTGRYTAAGPLTPLG